MWGKHGRILRVFAGFFTPLFCHFWTPFFGPPIFHPRGPRGPKFRPLPIYIIYVSFRTYFAKKICGESMGEFCGFFRVFSPLFFHFFGPLAGVPRGYPPKSDKIDPFLYILFTLVLGHILQKKYVGKAWENFAGFFGFFSPLFFVIFWTPIF